MVPPSACCWGARRAGSRCSLGQPRGECRWQAAAVERAARYRGAHVSVGIDRGASEGSTSGEVHRLVLPDNACSVGISKSEKRVEADEIRTALGSSSRSCRVACDGWVPKRRSRLSGVGKAAGDLRRPQTRACGREPGRSEALALRRRLRPDYARVAPLGLQGSSPAAR
jgi:hypothetical protein